MMSFGAWLCELELERESSRRKSSLCNIYCSCDAAGITKAEVTWPYARTAATMPMARIANAVSP